MSDTPVSSEGAEVFERLCRYLEASGCVFEVQEHPPVRTAVEAAQARGTALHHGVKALLLKVEQDMRLFVLGADMDLASAVARKALGVRRMRFATQAELLELTGLLPGAVPPFGEPVLPFKVFVDPSALRRDSMVFTAGSRKRSVRMATSDYQRVVEASVFPFAQPGA